jgi:uncharacterized membrane protein YccC
MHRFIGCATGGPAAAIALQLTHHLPIAMTICACLGVVVGRHIENSKSGVAHVGTQFALAFLVLAPDTYSTPDLAPGLDRLFGILFGMVLLELIRVLPRLL